MAQVDTIKFYDADGNEYDTQIEIGNDPDFDNGREFTDEKEITEDEAYELLGVAGGQHRPLHDFCSSDETGQSYTWYVGDRQLTQYIEDETGDEFWTLSVAGEVA